MNPDEFRTVIDGKAEAAGDDFNRQSTLDTLLQNIITSSAIEDEKLNVESMRSSLAHRFPSPARDHRFLGTLI
jgi:hypothetical protein